MRLIIYILFLGLSLETGAADFTSAGSGDWNNGNTWGFGGGGPWTAGIHYPSIFHTADIATGHTVTIPANFAAFCNILTVNTTTYCTDSHVLFGNSRTSLTVNQLFINPAGAPCSPAGVYRTTIDMNGGTMTVNTGGKFATTGSIGRSYNISIYLGGGTLNIDGSSFKWGSGAPLICESVIDFENNSSSTVNFSGDSIFNDDFPIGNPNRNVQFSNCTTGGELNLTKSGEQKIYTGNSLFNVNLSGSGNKSFPSGLSVYGLIDFGGTSALVTPTSFWNVPGGYIKYLGSGAGISYSGSASQTIGEELTAIINVAGFNSDTIPKLVINNSSGVVLSASDSVVITDTLTLTSGVFSTSKTDGTSIVMTEDAVLKSAGTASSYVSPSMTRIIGGADGLLEIPIGTATAFTPVFGNPTNTASWVVSAYDGAHPQSSTPDQNVSHYWDLDATGSDGATIKFGWESANVGADFNSNAGSGVYVGHYAGGGWTEYLSTYTSDGDMRFARITGYNDGYSPFAVGAGGGSLPVELTAFDATYHDRTVQLEWETASESNNDYFVLERSLDAEVFETIGMVEGSGNSNQLISYNFIDSEPINGLIYYRLKQVDYDGKYAYSDVKALSVSLENHHSLSVYPNPVSKGELLKVEIPNNKTEATLDIYNTAMQKVCSFLINSESTSIDLSILPSGVYTLSILQQNKLETRKIMIQ